MIERGDRDLWVLRRLRQYKGALNDSLGIEREALGGPSPDDAVFPHRCFDFGFERCGVLTDGRAARIPDSRMRLMDFLYRRPGKTGEFARLAVNQCLAEIDIGE